MKKKVTIFTDGACSGNPGPGGYAAILRYKEQEKEIFGALKETTNNRMELTAVIMALKTLKEPCEVEIFSDSKYVVDSFKKGWISNWQKNGWKTSNRKPVLNVDLWKELLILLKVHDVTFFWVKGHNAHPENERCDSLAVNEMVKMINNGV
ncbi:MAG: ribonuclease HI [Oscillospiraceae bacterium]|nr:ribonuclease HI [Oscillospiraceae bacterium]